MTAALMWWGAAFFGLAAYPTIAGLVFRKLGAPGSCGGRGKMLAYPILDCRARWNICWRDGHVCAQCQRYLTAAHIAWLWPLTGVLMIPRWFFNAGANVTTHPTHDSLPEQSDATVRP